MADIHIKLQTALAPLSGVVVRLYDTSTEFGVYLAESTTDANGIASFVSYPAGTYLVRVRVPSTTPFIVNGGLTHTITLGASDIKVTLTATSVAMPTSSSPAFCRCSGYFTNIAGNSVRQRQIYFKTSNSERPAIVFDGTEPLGILHHDYTLVLDNNGYGSVDLPRNACMYAFLPADISIPRFILIPDAAAANLVDILYPYPSSVAYYDGATEVSSITIASGTPKELNLVCSLRSGVVGDPAYYFVAYTSPTGLNVSIAHNSSTLTLTGAIPGIYTLTPTALPEDFALPPPAISGTLQVEVT